MRSYWQFYFGSKGRLIDTNHGKIETPSFVPVIHPVKQSIPAKKIKEIGFDVVITNAYITMKRLEDKARKDGIHKIIKYDRVINNILLNFQSAKILGANYVISKFPIKNNELKIICYKCNNSDFIFLYKIL